MSSTLRGDTRTKALLYAQNGIREYWVVSIAARELIVYRSPSATGYADVQTLHEGETIAPLARPDDRIAVSSVFI